MKQIQHLNYDIDIELWKKVGKLAIDLGITRNEVIEKALEEYIDEEAS